ncbi:MAG: 7-cyano-7-deazaguanine synthase QueC [Campylobacterales bacterium]
MKHKKALVVFSGGQDSTTCLGWALKRFSEIETITFDYGQRHRVEIDQAKLIAQKLGVQNTLFEMDTFAKLSDSALVNKEQDINRPHSANTTLPASYVPNRNALMFTVAHAYAQKIEANHLVTGVCESDYSGYPDCRQEFVQSLERSLNLGSNRDIEFHYPLMFLDKADTFALAKKEGVLDVVIDMSHTCYNGDRKNLHEWGYGCGDCPACKLRENGWIEYKRRRVDACS